MPVHGSGPRPRVSTNLPTFATTCNPPPALRQTVPFEQGGVRTNSNSSGTTQVISSTDPNYPVDTRWWETPPDSQIRYAIDFGLTPTCFG